MRSIIWIAFFIDIKLIFTIQKIVYLTNLRIFAGANEKQIFFVSLGKNHLGPIL